LMVEPSTEPLIRSRTPLPNSISTLFRAAAGDVAASGPDTTASGENLVTARPLARAQLLAPAEQLTNMNARRSRHLRRHRARR
jgi:hypothetical protein